jgi:hypothetical protein
MPTLRIWIGFFQRIMEEVFIRVSEKARVYRRDGQLGFSFGPENGNATISLKPSLTFLNILAFSFMKIYVLCITP